MCASTKAALSRRGCFSRAGFDPAGAIAAAAASPRPDKRGRISQRRAFNCREGPLFAAEFQRLNALIPVCAPSRGGVEWLCRLIESSVFNCPVCCEDYVLWSVFESPGLLLNWVSELLNERISGVTYKCAERGSFRESFMQLATKVVISIKIIFEYFWEVAL